MSQRDKQARRKSNKPVTSGTEARASEGSENSKSSGVAGRRSDREEPGIGQKK
jgi:hypothetical protein